MKALNPIQINILYELSRNSRISEKELALKLKISRQLVKYHKKTLVDRGLIKGFRTRFNFGRLGYKYYFATLNVNTSPNVLEKISEFIGEYKQSIWISRVFGQFDIIVDFRVNNYEEIQTMLSEIITKFSEFEITPSVIYVVHIYKNGPASFIRSLDPNISFKFDYPKLSSLKENLHDSIPLSLDERQIIQILVNESNISYREIARRIGRSITYVASVYKKLKFIKLFREHTIIVDYLKFNVTRYKILIKFKIFSDILEQKFYNYVNSVNSIVYADHCLGEFNATINFVFQSPNNLNIELNKFKDMFAEELKSYNILVLSEVSKHLTENV